LLVLAAVLGLWHALDPDDLVAISSLAAARRRDVRSGMRIGAWRGVGHAFTLLLLGTR
jgi:high-affinity nickel permease